MWEKVSQYRAHMKVEHGVDIVFEAMLGERETFPCSHVYFKGELVNMLRNYENEEFKMISYRARRGRHDQLYFCGCSCRKVVFGEERDFYEHIIHHLRVKLLKGEG